MNPAKLGAFAVILFSVAVLTNPAFASTAIDFSNQGGTLSGTNAGLSLSGSTLIAVTGWNGSSTKITGDLGTVTFTTVALTGGSLEMGGTFAAGGTFQIDGNGTGSLPNGALFSGSFSGPITWTETTLANHTHNYTLTGVITGTINGTTVNAVTVQLTINTGKAQFSGTTTISGGDTTIGSVPESSSLLLFGSGVIALLALTKRKLLTR